MTLFEDWIIEIRYGPKFQVASSAGSQERVQKQIVSLRSVGFNLLNPSTSCQATGASRLPGDIFLTAASKSTAGYRRAQPPRLSPRRPPRARRSKPDYSGEINGLDTFETLK
ncbi:hypothetical protein EVAR_22828_1 [Eumeta japonica]|uniref:Uncharacterized protein n=1 Tax=Eumeta variegata TaxID=151549 RepID=A0A4C1VEV9_EUMVA|nr:hypothetical protein EVAR_22828_1 [Eumeta japonica]